MVVNGIFLCFLILKKYIKTINQQHHQKRLSWLVSLFSYILRKWYYIKRCWKGKILRETLITSTTSENIPSLIVIIIIITTDTLSPWGNSFWTGSCIYGAKAWGSVSCPGTSWHVARRIQESNHQSRDSCTTSLSNWSESLEVLQRFLLEKLWWEALTPFSTISKKNKKTPYRSVCLLQIVAWNADEGIFNALIHLISMCHSYL